MPPCPYQVGLPPGAAGVAARPPIEPPGMLGAHARNCSGQAGRGRPHHQRGEGPSLRRREQHGANKRVPVGVLAQESLRVRVARQYTTQDASPFHRHMMHRPLSKWCQTLRFEVCFLSPPSTQGAGCKTRHEARIKQGNPPIWFIYNWYFQAITEPPTGVPPEWPAFRTQHVSVGFNWQGDGMMFLHGGYSVRRAHLLDRDPFDKKTPQIQNQHVDPKCVSPVSPGSVPVCPRKWGSTFFIQFLFNFFCVPSAAECDAGPGHTRGRGRRCLLLDVQLHQRALDLAPVYR